MDKILVIHNSQCSKSRQALDYLKAKGIEPELRFYLKEPLSAAEIKALLKKLKIKARDLIRKKEAIYTENYAGRTLSEQEWIAAMVLHPRLIERPIVINGDKAVIARPTEIIDTVL